jgi:hypothetical protein
VSPLLVHPTLPARASTGSLLRAKALQSYLHQLQSALLPLPPMQAETLLWVLNPTDWEDEIKAPYGLWVRRKNHLFVPTRYPEKLVWRLREALVPVLKQLKHTPSTSIADFLDFCLGYGYMHILAGHLGLLTRNKELDSLLAHCLHLLALKSLPELYSETLAWHTALARLESPSSLLQNLTYQSTAALEALPFAKEEILQELLSKGKNGVRQVFSTLTPDGSMFHTT